MRTELRVLSASLGLLFLISAFPGCTREPSDAELTQSVQAKLRSDPELSAALINVSTSGGVVTLLGGVNSEADRSRAVELARSVEGVQSVNNNLTTRPVPTPEISQDDPLKTRVEANLGTYGITGITVTVANGEVTLKGDVPRAKLQDAMKAANEAHPKRIINQLTVK